MSVIDDFATHILAEHWSKNCDFELKLMRKFMESDRFDDLKFLNYETGQLMKGSELRDCQTGCEMLKKRGFHKHGSFSEIQQCGCKQFDEQLQFVNEEDKPLSNVDYCITRADGMKVKGTTDNEGKTKRIKNTQQEMAIEKAEFYASEWTQPLCPQNRIPPGTLIASLELSDVKTTMTDVGSSVRKITIKGGYRPLTAGEIDMAMPVFKDAINYDDVKVYNKKFWLTFGLQPDDVAMVPDGNLYCPDSVFKEDFSEGSKKEDTYRIWFIHEMTHVWQTQLGLSTIRSAVGLAIKGGYGNDDPVKPPIGYRYDPAKSIIKTLPDFNFEQQAEIISHYFAAQYLKNDDYLTRLPFLKSVLKNFLIRPKDKGLLPR